MTAFEPLTIRVTAPERAVAFARVDERDEGRKAASTRTACPVTA